MGIFKKNNANVNSQTFYNLLSTIMRSGVVFITMPIFSRLLGTAQYGEYSIYVSWLTILGCFMGLNVKSSLGTGIIAFSKDYKRFRSSVLLEGTGACIVTVLVLLLLYKPLNIFVGYPFYLYCLLVFEAFAQFLIDYVNFAWVYEKNAKNNMILATITVATTSLLSIYLIFIWQWGEDYKFVGRAIGTAVPQILIGVFVWIYISNACFPKYDEKYWRYGLHFGLPMVIHLFSQQILVQSDRLMMKSMGIDSSDIGIYSFFYTFVAILTTILGALNNSWCPFLYDELKNRNYLALNKRVGYYVQLFTCLSLGFLLVSRETTYFFADSEYWAGMDLIPLFVIIIYTTYFYQFAVNYEIFNARTKYVAIGTSVAAISNIILNYLFIGRLGIWGAGIATLFSYIILAALHTILVKRWKYERYPLSYKFVWIGFGVVVLGSLAFYALAELIVVRWLLAVLVGCYLVWSIYKRKQVF